MQQQRNGVSDVIHAKEFKEDSWDSPIQLSVGSSVELYRGG
jgi:hypothetical protein